MNNPIVKAYKILFDSEVSNLEEWEIAEKIISNWNVSKLGEDLAKEVIFKIVNHINFPDEVKTKLIVGEAEEKGVELFPEIGEHDPSMDVYEWLENKYNKAKEKTKEGDEGNEMKII